MKSGRCWKQHEEEDDAYDFLEPSHHSKNSPVFPLAMLNRERGSDDLGTIGDYELLKFIGRGAMGII